MLNDADSYQGGGNAIDGRSTPALHQIEQRCLAKHTMSATSAAML